MWENEKENGSAAPTETETNSECSDTNADPPVTHSTIPIKISTLIVVG